MKPAELTALHELLDSPYVTFSGDTIDRILKAVDEVMAGLHWCDVCDCRMPLAQGHPHCAACTSALMIEKCPKCLEHFCFTPHAHADCFRMHACCQVDGPNQYDVLRG